MAQDPLEAARHRRAVREAWTAGRGNSRSCAVTRRIPARTAFRPPSCP